LLGVDLAPTGPKGPIPNRVLPEFWV
jgi:hypothetical protein